jgi:hypothetical protein
MTGASIDAPVQSVLSKDRKLGGDWDHKYAVLWLLWW